jgi:hypothetical protein
MEAKYTVLRFTKTNKQTKVARPAWVETISWGDGRSVKKVFLTNDREKAARLSSTTALAVAEQFFTHVIALDWQDGTPNVELTAQLLQSQMAKLHLRSAMVQKRNAEMRAFWNEMVTAVPELAKIASLR